MLARRASEGGKDPSAVEHVDQQRPGGIAAKEVFEGVIHFWINVEGHEFLVAEGAMVSTSVKVADRRRSVTATRRRTWCSKP
jgi:hypothetical protein